MDTNNCILCGEITRLVCKGCKTTAYCSDDCLWRDNNLHQRLCKKVAEFITKNPRPKNTYYLAPLFDVERRKDSELIWVEAIDVVEVEDGVRHSSCDLSKWLGDGREGFNHVRQDRKMQVWSVPGATVENLDISTFANGVGGWIFELELDTYPERLKGSVVIMGVDEALDGKRVAKYPFLTAGSP